MRYIVFDKKSKLTIGNVEVELEIVGEQIHGLTLRSGNDLVKIESDSTYSNLRILTPAPPKMVDKFELSGTFVGIKVSEFFDHEHEAINRRETMNLCGDENNALEIKKVQVPEEL